MIAWGACARTLAAYAPLMSMARLEAEPTELEAAPKLPQCLPSTAFASPDDAPALHVQDQRDVFARAPQIELEGRQGPRLTLIITSFSPMAAFLTRLPLPIPNLSG